MKRLFPIIMVLLTALAVGSVFLFSTYQARATGGQAPEIHFAQEELNVDTGSGDRELLQGVTAADKEDGDVTASLMVEHISQFVEKDTVEVTYVAYDSQNHVSRATRRVHYNNYQPPRFSLSGPMVFLSKNVADLMNYVDATDVVDGNISIKAHASFDDTTTALSAVGVHNVELSVTNTLGDTVRLLVPVKVMEDVPHSENIPLKAYLVYVQKGDAFDANFYLASAEQGNGSSSMGESEIQISSGVNTNQEGVYAVDYSLVRNEVVTATTRLIVVVE